MNQAIQYGHFELSSGRHTDTYIQCSNYLANPNKLAQLGKALAQEWGGPVDMVVSPAVGGVVIGYEVAKRLEVPFAFTERVDGDMAFRRGFDVPDGAKVLIVEDVVTTGISAGEVKRVVEDHGGEAVGLLALAKRYATVPGFDEVISLHVVQAPVWDSWNCPLCEKGVELDTPGSRNLS